MGRHFPSLFPRLQCPWFRSAWRGAFLSQDGPLPSGPLASPTLSHVGIVGNSEAVQMKLWCAILADAVSLAFSIKSSFLLRRSNCIIHAILPLLLSQLANTPALLEFGSQHVVVEATSTFGVGILSLGDPLGFVLAVFEVALVLGDGGAEVIITAQAVEAGHCLGLVHLAGVRPKGHDVPSLLRSEKLPDSRVQNDLLLFRAPPKVRWSARGRTTRGGGGARSRDLHEDRCRLQVIWGP